jgi:hypothetical protein
VTAPVTLLEPESQQIIDGALASTIATESADPEAPFGRKPDGTPYKVSPEDRARLGQQMAAGRQRAAQSGAAGRSRTTRGGRKGSAAPGRTRAATPPPPTYQTQVAGLMQLPAMVLGILSRWVPSLAYDSLAISYHTPPIAAAVAGIALTDARWAAVIEKTASVGPYGEFTIAVIPLVLQFAANHRFIPANPEAGILEPEQLASAMGLGDGPTQPDA